MMGDDEIVSVRHDAPTLSMIFRTMTIVKRDRVALMREAKPGLEAAVVVLLLSYKAIRDCGPVLLDFARELGPQDGSQVLQILYKSRLDFVPTWMDQVGVRWVQVKLEPGGSALLVAFTGTEICGRIARELSARGCPC